MSRTVIQVEGLGKRYRIGQPRHRNALSHVIGDALRAPVRLLGGNSSVRSASSNGDKNVNGGSASFTDRSQDKISSIRPRTNRARRRFSCGVMSGAPLILKLVKPIKGTCSWAANEFRIC